MTLPIECRRLLQSISAYLDGDLDAPSCEILEAHGRECQRCAALIAGLRETAGLCRQAASLPLPDAVRQRAQESVRRLLEHADADERP
jgi:anti-sigma factor RsiW